jgi:hypothetical protein
MLVWLSRGTELLTQNAEFGKTAASAENSGCELFQVNVQWRRASHPISNAYFLGS